VSEDGSELADELWDAADMRVANQLVYPEARAALAAANHASRIHGHGLRRAVKDLEAASAAMTLVGVDAALAREAGKLAEQHALRGYDAVHLATALSGSDPDLVLVTWDRDLARAALESGCSVAPRSGAISQPATSSPMDPKGSLRGSGLKGRSG
jgi:predicted nucleic acid-binding protein